MTISKMDIKELQKELYESKEKYDTTEKEQKQLKNKINAIENLLASFENLLTSCNNYEQGLKLNFSPAYPLTCFLNSDLVTLDPKLYCRQKVFVTAFNDYCKNNHLTSGKWTNKYYFGPFNDFKLKVLYNGRKRYPNVEGSKVYTETFIIGVDVKCGNYESDESDSE